MTKEFLKIDNLTVTYKKDTKPSLTDINLTIKEGECIAFIGESGCGKTSLLRSINGLAKHYYEANVEGKVIFKDKNLLEHEPEEISREVGTLFQNPRSQFFNVDTSAEIIFGCENLGIEKEEIFKRINYIIKKLDIEKLINRNIFELSGGEKQKVALASILAMNPSILLLDEVSSNLDIQEVGRIKEILEDLKGQGKTIILSEHRMYWLKDIVDRYVFIQGGKIEKIFKREEMLNLSNEDLKGMGIRPFKINPAKCDKCKVLFNMNTESFESIRDKKMRVGLTPFNCNTGVVGVVGRNGSGKSTLIEGMLEFIKKDGDIKVDHKEIKMRDCSYVMQDVSRQLFSETVEDEVKLGNNCSTEDVENILEILNLKEKKKNHPQTLSGGEKQRLAIATSILSGKKICVMDEPTSGLDFKNMKRLSKVIEDLNSNGTMVIIITHDLEIIDLCCDSIIEIGNYKGKNYEYTYENLALKFDSWYNLKK